ncbi:MAG: hypothetical protein AWM53_01558 [Candidatus Dichloromethanomonas elyunquensis]|nr:MAG: hypothetical protein AWM53_01558 [Candidatus Dichloromethanomonas elyunquensis]
MNRQALKIQYIYHSGFRVETEKHILIFDYFQGPIHLGDKKTYVFSSHSHPDHFNPAIFSWQNQNPDTSYILSRDISLTQKQDHVYFLSPCEEITIDDLKIKAYGSTDLGVSFLVQCLGVNLFHAGDLNWWHWWKDIPEENAKAEVSFKEEISRMKGENVNIAFFPVDSRLEHYYCIGADYFIQEISPAYLIPMHFGDDLQTPMKYAKIMEKSPTKVISVSKPGQEFYLPFYE